jgi:hypothetical protein
MLEPEPTDRAEPGAVHWCLVYSNRDGRVIHVHQFIGGDSDVAESDAQKLRARMALGVARLHSDPKHLRVMHASQDFHLEPGMRCRVDLASGQLVTVPRPELPPDLGERVRARKSTPKKAAVKRSKKRRR